MAVTVSRPVAHNMMLTVRWETCQFPGPPSPGIKAAGPGVQFGAGLLAWPVLHLLSPNATSLRCFVWLYFVWLYMVFTLFASAGYSAFSGVTNLGAAAELIARLHPPVAWRGGLILLGSVVYFLSMRVAALELKRLPASMTQPAVFFASSGFICERRNPCVLYWRLDPNDGARSRDWIGSSIFLRGWIGYVGASE